ncbi:ATP-dependent RecD-like DNA helicase, partial [Lactobacillus taiwanensis]|uniref:SF1B family DNA helicase RecD2 n=1 Tax=Lactobacillus taiwanensis TaxID=508451 RepID=UPI00241CAA19
MTKTSFTGRINGIVFENNQDLFKIIDVDLISRLADFDRDNIRVTGNFGDIQIGSTYKFTGQIVVHEKFGKQFRVSSYEPVLPHEEGSLTKYLSSDKFPGIGKKAAEKIIDSLGTDALDLIKANPTEIETLDLTQKQKDSLLSGINQMDSFSEIVIKLAKYGINKKIAGNIYKAYHGESLKKLEDDPYQAVGEIRGFGFKTADNIGRALNIGANDPRRIRGAILSVLQTALSTLGDTYVPLDELLTQAYDLIQASSYDDLANSVNELQRQGKVVVSGDKAALQGIFQTELDIANELKCVVKNQVEKEVFSDKEIDHAISHAEDELEIKYDETQKNAIRNALNNPLSILTGGPGTGKTTIINGILMCLKELAGIPSGALYSEDPPFLLAAPTGRAAKRMSEITDISAKTIHRLLGLGIGENDATDVNELNGEILIIDEMSMVDMFLFKQLLSGINSTKRIVFVGDQDQLPSVGAGNIFSDLIKSDAFPTTRLQVIHRQGEDSSIIKLAHAINEEAAEQVIFDKTKNYSFIPCQPSLVGDAIDQIVNLAIKRGFKKDDVQVLGAMYNGQGGITHLNDILQDVMNPMSSKTKVIEAHNESFRIGDRILQLQNNPEKDIYNGQIGKIIGLNPDDKAKILIADFDGKEIEFGVKDLNDITRAYAITIHKSQGSEFPLVILNLTMQNYMMLRRNLLYTAITRAEKNLVMVGEKKAYIMALRTPGNDRKTDLAFKIRHELGLKEVKTEVKSDESTSQQVLGNNSDRQTKAEEPKDYILTPDLIYSGKIDPMIGMEDIKLKSR